MRTSLAVVLFIVALAACAGVDSGVETAETIVTTTAVLSTETTAPATTTSSPSPSTTAPPRPSSTSSTSPPTTAASPINGLEMGDHEFLIAHDGIDRRYVAHMPPGVESSAALVIVLHGGGGTAAQMKAEVGMDAIADREGFIVIYPDGTGPLPDRLHTWNGGFNCCGSAQTDNVDDVGFIRAVVADISERVAVDPDRVAVTGQSNGAILAYRIAAEASDLVRVAVPVAGAMALNNFGPANPVAILHIHSVDDPRALYNGGEGPVFPGTTHTVLHEPVAAGLAAWAAINGCNAEASEVDSGNDGDQSFTRFEYSACTDGAPLVHLRLAGIGHGWPGVESGREDLIGPATNLVDASEEVWAFASAVWDN